MEQYRPTIGLTEKPNFLTTDWVLGVFGDDRQKAVSEYQRFVAAGKHASSPWQDLKNQIYLGSERFVEQMQARSGTGRRLEEIPRKQRRPIAKPLE